MHAGAEAAAARKHHRVLDRRPMNAVQRSTILPLAAAVDV
jgi:hypothetical protein